MNRKGGAQGSKTAGHSALAGVAQWIELPVQFPVRHMPGLRAMSLVVGGAREATTH